MSRLRPLKPRVLIKLLAKFGFFPLRQKGSHLIIRNSFGKGTVVPLHGNEEIDSQLIRTILRECEISLVDFLKVANEV